MKSIVIVAFLIGLVSIAECHNFKNSLSAQAVRKAQAVDDCNVYECAAIGTRCTQSPACVSCENQFTACLTTSTDTCACATQLLQCVTTNATDDKANCNPTLIYQNCKAQLPTCGCGNFTQVVPIPVCNLESFCNNQTGTCQQKTGQGQYCVDNTDCSSLPWAQSAYTCVNNKCEETDYTAPIGDSCTNDDDCVNAFTDEVSCTNGVCVGQGQGGNCTNSGSCNFGLFCNGSTLMTTGTCMPMLAIGSDCDSDADNCAYPGVCGFGDKCVKAFSKARGQSCNEDAECTTDSICTNKVCAAIPAAKACTTTSDCPTSQGYTGECVCDDFTGKSMCEIDNLFLTACSDEAVAFFECISNNKCNGYDLGSDCVTKNCKNQASCYYTCGFSAGGSPANCYPSLTCGSTTGSTTGSAVATQVSVGLVALTIAALAL